MWKRELWDIGVGEHGDYTVLSVFMPSYRSEPMLFVLRLSSLCFPGFGGLISVVRCYTKRLLLRSKEATGRFEKFGGVYRLYSKIL